MDKELIQYIVNTQKEILLELKKLNLKFKFIDKICKDITEIKKLLNEIKQNKQNKNILSNITIEDTIKDIVIEDTQEDIKEVIVQNKNGKIELDTNDFILY